MSIYKMRTQFGGALKILLGIIAFGFLVGAIFSFGPGGMSGGGQGGERTSEVIAKVNGSEIKRADFEVLWEQAIEQAKSQGVRSPLAYADYRGYTFQQLVRSRLLLAAAKQMGVDVSDRRVEDEIEKAIEVYLRQNREVVLGKLGRKRAEMDPRYDDEYKSELASIGSSISQQEDFVRSRIPVEQAKSQLAQRGVEEKLKSSIKRVTDKDVMNSYNVYQVRQIMLMRGKLPEEQIRTRANKIIKEAGSGANFDKLARANTDGPGKANGGWAEYSFSTRYMFPLEVRDAIEKMKPGEVSGIIDAGMALYIVKLESVTPKLPANLDYKTKAARRKELQQEREMMARFAFERKLRGKQRVEVLDPELLAYWQLSEAQQSMGDQVAYKKKMALAASSLKRAIADRPNNDFARAKLAQIESQAGNTEEAIRLLYPMLEGETATVEGADLRMMLGDLLMKKKEKDKAIEQYKVASEVARDLPTHQQLLKKFQQLGMTDLASVEQSWVTDYQKRAEEMKALQGKNAPKPGRK